jgi:hypothetical protein
LKKRDPAIVGALRIAGAVVTGLFVPGFIVVMRFLSGS